MLVSKDEYNKKVKAIEEALKGYIWFEPGDLVKKGIFKNEVDVKSFIDKNKENAEKFGVKRLNYTRKVIYETNFFTGEE